MYNNNTHYPAGYQGYSQYPAQSYTGSYGNYPGYAGYSNPSTQPSLPGQEAFPSNNWSATYSVSDPKDAVAQEMQQQKAQLIRQREDYVKKASVLKHELEQLQMQKQDLVGNGRSPDSELTNILKQNDKLQDEIQGKLKAIHNVIEMLSSIIKDSKSVTDLEAELAEPEQSKPKSSPASKPYTDNSYKSHTPDEYKKNSADTYCYVHYDTGLHWCRMCDEFPETAKDFLLHLQEKKHREMVKDNDVDSTPWHKLPAEMLMPSDESAPKKRVPIKGLQFFISAPSWYCKLCDVWIGDLHCASQHLKSRTHHQNYENFVSQNPHWEMDWLQDREKTMARKEPQDSSESDGAKKKRKQKEKRLSADLFALKEKKKKKKSRKKKSNKSSDSSSSSSSSDSSSDDDNEDRSRSIRVAMRNMKQVQSIMDEDLTAKWNVLEKLVEEHKKKEQKDKLEKEKREGSVAPDDPLINQWMTISQPPPKDKIMLESLKDRMRQKQEHERSRLAEMEKHRREKEREDAEKLERRKREEKLAAEEEDRKRKIKEQEELERIRDKERNQVRFKTNNYRRKKRSYSRSDDEELDEREDRHYKRERSSYRSYHSRSRSRSSERRHEREEGSDKKKPPGPPSYKKLPFIGRMPLFKNRGKNQDDKEERKEIKKQSYEIPRRTRFEPGNLPKAFMPKPDVVCFPKLSSIPPLNIPPPAPAVIERVPIPVAPKISVDTNRVKPTPKPPPPPKLDKKEEITANLSDDEVLYGSEGGNPHMMRQYYQNYGNNVYEHEYQYSEEQISPPPPPPHSHSMPLQPPPLPPDDDLALLGICADDMAAQSF